METCSDQDWWASYRKDKEYSLNIQNYGSFQYQRTFLTVLIDPQFTVMKLNLTKTPAPDNFEILLPLFNKILHRVWFDSHVAFQTFKWLSLLVFLWSTNFMMYLKNCNFLQTVGYLWGIWLYVPLHDFSTKEHFANHQIL